MKKLLLFILILTLSHLTNAQGIVGRAGPANTVEDWNFAAKKLLLLPRYTDTTNATTLIDSCGAIIFTRSDSKIWKRSCSPKMWVEIGTGGSTFNPVQGNRMKLTGTYPDITFNAIVPGNIDTATVGNFISQSVTPKEYRQVYWSTGLNLFLAAVNGASHYATSPDGITWTDRTIPTPGSGTSGSTRMFYIPRLDKFLFCTRDTLWASTDAINWTPSYSLVTANGTISRIVDAPALGRMVAIVSSGTGNSSKIFTSPDGSTWTERTNPNSTSALWNGLAWSPTANIFFAVSHYIGSPSNNVKWMTSPDGITWTSRTPTVANFAPYGAVNWSTAINKFLMTLSSNTIYTSSDGINWASTAAGTYLPTSYNKTTAVFEAIVSGVYYTSVDGITNWTSTAIFPTGTTAASQDFMAISTTTLATVASAIPLQTLALLQSSIGLFSGLKDGLVPKSGGGSTKFLRSDAFWVTPEVTASNTTTLTNKRYLPRAVEYGPSANPDIIVDISTYDLQRYTQLQATTVTVQSQGTPVAGERFSLAITDDGTSKNLVWTSSFRGSTDLPLPTATTPGKTMYLVFIYNGSISKWDLIHKLDNF